MRMVCEHGIATNLDCMQCRRGVPGPFARRRMRTAELDATMPPIRANPYRDGGDRADDALQFGTIAAVLLTIVVVAFVLGMAVGDYRAACGVAG